MPRKRVRCPKCGTENAIGEERCVICGIGLGWALDHWKETVLEPGVPPLILLSDDEPGGLMLFGIMLTRSRFRVAKTKDPYQTLELAERLQPSMIITDILKPGMDGVEMTHRLKANPATRDIPVFAVSATLSRDETIIEATEAGAAWFLAKPVDSSEFLVLVDNVLRRDRKVSLVCDEFSHDTYLALLNERLRVLLRARNNYISLTRAIKPDVIAVAMKFSESDEWDVLSEIRADPDLSGIPVLILAEGAGPEIEARAVESGAFGVFKDHPSGNRLAWALRSAIEKSKSA